jgi:hypothetical protein
MLRLSSFVAVHANPSTQRGLSWEASGNSGKASEQSDSQIESPYMKIKRVLDWGIQRICKSFH